MRLEELVREAIEEIEETVHQKLDLLESISDCFYSLDKDLRFTYVNESAGKAWGLSKAELAGKKIEDVFPEISQVLKENVPQHYELYSNVTNSWVYMNVYPATDGISVFWQDFSELKETQLKLQKSKQYISDILASIKDPFFTLYREWRFSYANQAVHEQFSHFGVLHGQNIWHLFPKMVGTIFFEKYHEVMNHREPLCFEAESKYTGFWSQISVYRLAEGISVLFRDITERKEAEEALRHSKNEIEMERQRLFDVLDTLHFNICLITPDYHIAWCN